MASPGRRRSNQSGDNCCLGILLVGLGLFAAGWIISTASALYHSYPAGTVTLGSLTAGGWAFLYLKSRKRKKLREEEARQRARRRAEEQAQAQHAQSLEIARYHTMSAREFEEAIAFLCRRDGCSNVLRVGGPNDLGADVKATAPDGRKIVIQCKRYGPSSKVSSPDLQRFGGTCFSVHGAQIAIVVTTSGFTRQAADYAARQGIRVLDEHALGAWASRTGRPPWLQ